MIVLYNPLSATPGRQPLPLAVLSLAAALDRRHPWTIVDGNVVPHPATEIVQSFAERSDGEPALLAVTVMPGPQLAQAVSVCRAVRQKLPHVRIVWGGYFPTQHTDAVLRSSFVDFVVRSQGEGPLVQLVEALEGRRSFEAVGSLSWKADDVPVHNPIQPLTPLDDLPDLPYHRVDMRSYIHPTYVGRRTVAHASSFGCPFACGFCAVVAMSNRRWLAQSPARLERVVRHLVDEYRVDAVQMLDMDFFISEARAAEFADRITPLAIQWRALGRVDTLMQYADTTWRLLADSGLKMIAAGVESASPDTLRAMNKGGKASPPLALALAARTRRFGIVPEYSFVLGSPPDPAADLAQTFELIRAIKRVNPATEIALSAYTPVPVGGTLLLEAMRLGFQFPCTLDEWASEKWRAVVMRRGDGIPWLDAELRQRIRDFERVLNAYYPTITDRRLTGLGRALLRIVSAWRYRLRIYAAPFELRALHRVVRYQPPETAGF